MADPLGAVEDRWRISLVVIEREASLVLHAEPTRAAVPCPCGGTVSRRQHSSYFRLPRDLAWRGAAVRLASRRLALRYDRQAASVLAFLHLACALICLRYLAPAEADAH